MPKCYYNFAPLWRCLDCVVTNRQQRRRGVFMARVYPVGLCLECSQSKPIMAKDLCKQCYSRQWSRKKRGGGSREEYFSRIGHEREERSFGICATCGQEKKLQSLGKCKACYVKTVGRIVICSRCGKERKHEGLGLCAPCYVNTVTQKNKTKKVTCAICQQEKIHKAKGLCEDCYRREHKRVWEKKIVTCANCGDKSKHAANGLCDRCYRNIYDVDTRKHHQRKERLNQFPATLTQGEWKGILKKYDYSCAYCKRSDCKLHKEHWIPLSRGGGYTKENIVPACYRCNSRKHTMTGDEFLEFLKKELEWEALSKSK